jgi:Uma2 family endonuclease
VYAGETGFRVARGQRTQATALAFVSRENQGRIDLPNLVAEFRSADTEAVVARWLNAGTQVVLVIDSTTKILIVYQKDSAVRVLRADEILALPEILPGWSLRIGDLFE